VIARNLGRVTAKPVRLADRDVVSTCSIGVAIYPQHGADAETLIRNADIAMYRAKRDGRAATTFFTPEMLDEAQGARAARAGAAKRRPKQPPRSPSARPASSTAP
jgi:predicted signal transduction protein with EAL and GGDEF domain